MEPREYEELVAKYYKSKGYETELTPYTGDYGVDVIARKGDEKIAIQAKMYGSSSRKVNRETMMQLVGAKEFHECNKAVIATDGECMLDAIEVAKRLNIEILYLDSSMEVILNNDSIVQHDEANMVSEISSPDSGVMSFDEMWKKHIMPLKGQTIECDGLENTIIDVDWGGLKRTTSTGNVGRIKIEEFKYAYNQLVEKGIVERTLINQHAKRCSSGIVLVLAQVPFIEFKNKPKRLCLKKK